MASDKRITSALQAAVTRVYKSGDHDSLTVKRIRASVEADLGLDDGFLKTDQTWNSKSKKIIQDQVELLEAGGAEPSSPASSPPNKIPSLPKRKPSPSPRKPPRKRSRATADSDSDNVSESSALAAPKPNKKQTAQSPLPEDSEARLLNDSELSDILDEAPSKSSSRKKQRKASSSRPSSKPAKTVPKVSTEQQDPQDDEIKRLQSQLVKCGVRKLWGKELKPFTSSRDKINHLRQMLKGVGMDGRFSEDKARAIKEERELKADLEAVTEGNKSWGLEGEDDDDGEESPPRRRRLAKGLKMLEALEGDEESD